MRARIRGRSVPKAYGAASAVVTPKQADFDAIRPRRHSRRGRAARPGPQARLAEIAVAVLRLLNADGRLLLDGPRPRAVVGDEPGGRTSCCATRSRPRPHRRQLPQKQAKRRSSTSTRSSSDRARIRVLNRRRPVVLSARHVRVRDQVSGPSAPQHPASHAPERRNPRVCRGVVSSG